MYCKKIKFSRTRYRAFGPELIAVYRQSATQPAGNFLSHTPAVGGKFET